ncbi:MAG: SH3 domain-containing protein [Planctomycetota bacterium]
MQAHIKSIILIILVGFASVGFAREAARPPGAPPLGKESAVKTGDTSKAAAPSFPYTAEVTEDNAPIRCGSGTNFYICGKLKKGDKVKVVSSKFNWSRIVPPSGSFSWISMRYVSIDPDNPDTGIVTADGIRVYAGSEQREPIHSETLQLKLNRGDEVKFIGKQTRDYFKITPPTGAYLWVSTKYTKPLATPVVKVIKPVVVPTPVDPNTDTKIDTKIDTKTDTNNVTKTDTNDIKALIPTTISGESENLKAYYALKKLIKAEQAKPADQQNYTNIKKALTVIAGNKDAGKAARYSEFAIRQIKGFELAMVITKEVQLQNEELKKSQAGIDKARATRLAQVEALGKYAIIGKFQTSNIFSSDAVKRYRIIDDKGKTVCYASPTGPISKKDLSKLAGSKVGLIGKIEASPQISGALVRFTEIVQLN